MEAPVECVFILPFLFLLVPIVLFAMGQQQKHKEALQELANTTAGLLFAGDEVKGTTQGVRVHVDTYTTGSGKNKSTWTRFRLSDPTSLHASTIASEGLFSGMGKLFSGDDVQLGDPVADDKLLLRGAEAEIVARMNPKAREIVRRAVIRGWEHSEGTWRFRRRGKMTNAAEMKAILAHGFEAVRCLRLDGNRLDALVERALTDPVPGAAARALEVRMKSGTPLSSEAEERLVAKGGITAVVVAERMGVRGIPLLTEALQNTSGETRLRAALSLAKLGEGTTSSRAVLAAALKVEVYQSVAIPALEKVGTVDQVPLLRPIAESWTHGERHAAKKAIRAIQSRITGAGVGQLSIAEAGGGDLAIAPEAAVDAESEREQQARAAQATGRQTEG